MGQAEVKKLLGLQIFKPESTKEDSNELPIFNTEQLTSDAMKREKVDGRYFECPHIKESRRDHDSDLFGYFEKHQVKSGELIAYVFIRWCEACAHKNKKDEAVVARTRYHLLSDRTRRTILKESRRQVPRSNVGLR